MTHSDLQIQRTDCTKSVVNNGNIHFIIDDSCDVDALQQGSGHFVTELDRTSLAEKCFDLEVSCPTAECSAVTLELCDDIATSEQVKCFVPSARYGLCCQMYVMQMHDCVVFCFVIYRCSKK